MQDPLKIVHHQNHDDDLGQFVLELVKRADDQHRTAFFFTGRLNFADEQLVDAEGKNQQYHGDQVQVDGFDDAGNDVFVKVFGVGAGPQGDQYIITDTQYVQTGNHKQDDRAEKTESHRKDNNKTAFPQHVFQKSAEHGGV